MTFGLVLIDGGSCFDGLGFGCVSSKPSDFANHKGFELTQVPDKFSSPFHWERRLERAFAPSETQNSNAFSANTSIPIAFCARITKANLYPNTL